MSVEIKDNKYIYLRYYNPSGKRVILYLGKLTPDGIEIKSKQISRASQYFYREGFEKYKIGELLESNPAKAISILTNKESLSKDEFMEWLKRQSIPAGSTGDFPELAYIPPRIVPSRKRKVEYVRRDTLTIFLGILEEAKTPTRIANLMKKVGLNYHQTKRYLGLCTALDMIEEVTGRHNWYKTTEKGNQMIEMFHPASDEEVSLLKKSMSDKEGI